MQKLLRSAEHRGRSATGGEDLLESIIEEGIEIRVGNEVDGTAVATVAAVGPTARHELLAAEAHRPAAAVPRGDVNVYFINEHRRLLPIDDCRVATVRADERR